MPDEPAVSRPSSANSNSLQEDYNKEVSWKLPYDSLATSLMSVLTAVLACLVKNNPMNSTSDACVERMSATNDTRSNDVIR